MASQFLTNSFLGPAYSLQVNSRSNHIKGLHARPSREGGLVWTLVPSPEDPGKYNICTTYKGKPKCLDIFKDDESNRTRVCLAEPGYYSGQAWTIIAQTEPGYYKLSNDWTGPGWYLDTYSDSYEAFMSQGDYSGQLWLLTSIGQATSSVVPPPYTPSHDNDSSDSSDSGKHKKHHHKAKKVAGGAAATYLAGEVFNKIL